MTLAEWTESSVDYGRKLVDSAVEGARTAEDEFEKSEPLAPFLEENARHAIASAVVGACLGALGGFFARGQHSRTRAVVRGLLGAAFGFSAGMVWESRRLTGSVTSGALKNVRKTRDEHWFERHPIDYA